MAKRNGKLVLASEELKGKQFVCPGCEQPVILKRGQLKIAHFAHKKNGCTALAENESQLHLEGKLALYSIAQKYDVKTQLETHFTEIKQRADVFLPTLKIVIEYQCSPIDQNQLLERTHGYHKLDYQVVWVLGNAYLNQQLTSTLLNKFARFDVNWGFYLLFWDAKTDRFVLLADIVEVAGQFHYQKSIYKSYQELLKFKDRCQFNQPLVTVSQQLKYLDSVAAQIQAQRSQMVYMVTQCYQFGKNLPACPIICHSKEAEFPLFGRQILFWRVLILLKIFNRETTKITKDELNQIFKETVSIFGNVFIQVPNFQRFYQLAFLQYFQELQNAGYLKQTYDTVVITRQPEWFLDLERKKIFWLEQSRRDDK